jgi:nuclear GTP-binding protein
MVLNDWSRGKIPYFVPPPDKEADSEIKKEGVVTEATGEAAKLLEEQERELGKALGEKRVKGVKQELKAIITMPKFMGDDVKRLADEESDEEMADGESDDAAAAVEDDLDDEDMEDDDEDEEEEDDDDDEVDEEDGDLAWEDVFPDDAEADAPPKKKAKRAAEAEVEEEGEETPGKEKRMTTNKKKSTNFYTFAVSPAARSRRPKLTDRTSRTATATARRPRTRACASAGATRRRWRASRLLPLSCRFFGHLVAICRAGVLDA